MLQRYVVQMRQGLTVNPVVASALILGIVICTGVILISSVIAIPRMGTIRDAKS